MYKSDVNAYDGQAGELIRIGVEGRATEVSLCFNS